MKRDEHEFDDYQPIGTNDEQAALVSPNWARLIRHAQMNRLIIDGVPGWTALTAVAAMLESPSMEVLLGLDTGIQVTQLQAPDVDPATLPLRYAVCVDGPIEQPDADAIEEALLSGASLLEADIRTAASVLSRSGVIEVQSRSGTPLLAVVAEMIRRFLARRLQCEHTHLPLPDAGIIDSLISATGRLAVRPIETEIYEDFVDLGLVLPETEEIGPATTSIVFDRTSRTWHID